MTGDVRPPAVILAGGLSRRMGTDKAMIDLATKPLALHVAERLAPQVSTVYLNAPPDHPLASVLPLLPDGKPDRPGPLAGVLAGLRAFAERSDAPTHILTTPCDTPFLPRDLVTRLAELAARDTIVMASSAGRSHPVAALWPVSLADDLDHWLDDPDHRRVFDFLSRHPVATVEFEILPRLPDPLDPFFNINTPEDLAVARRILEEGAP
jgi:molybdenum cofactor guanylyltransferase